MGSKVSHFQTSYKNERTSHIKEYNKQEQEKIQAIYRLRDGTIVVELRRIS